jgi:hypothetical protein
LKLVEQRWGLAPLGADANALSIGTALDFQQDPRSARTTKLRKSSAQRARLRLRRRPARFARTRS